METVIDILQKVLTWISSRRLWSTAITVTLALVALEKGVDIPFGEIDPLTNQAMIYVNFLIEVAQAVVLLLGGAYLTISFTSRPPTRKDYL